MTEIQTIAKPGFTSIARLITAAKAQVPSRSPAPAGSRPCERLTRSSKPPEKPQNSSTSTPTKSNNPPQDTTTLDYSHPRHPYLVAREAFTIGILTTLFLLTAIASEFTARTSSPVAYLLIPILAFLALHLLCVIASQLAILAKPLLRNTHRDVVQGTIILALFSLYAIFRIIHPIANWFTPIAWAWLAIIVVDLIGRILETTSKHPKP